MIAVTLFRWQVQKSAVWAAGKPLIVRLLRSTDLRARSAPTSQVFIEFIALHMGAHDSPAHVDFAPLALEGIWS